MIRQQHFDHFPLTWAEMRSTRDFNIFHPGDSFEIGPFKIRTFLLTHPGESIAYRIEAEGKVFIFSTDTEFFGTDLADQIQRADSFFRAADMLLMDAQYTVDESSQKIGWGHTAMDIAVDCASAWGVKHLVLTHHEPAHEDDRILSMFSDTLKHYEEIRKDRPRMNINLAFESDTYRL